MEVPKRFCLGRKTLTGFTFTANKRKCYFFESAINPISSLRSSQDSGIAAGNINGSSVMAYWDNSG